MHALRGERCRQEQTAGTAFVFVLISLSPFKANSFHPRPSRPEPERPVSATQVHINLTFSIFKLRYHQRGLNCLRRRSAEVLEVRCFAFSLVVAPRPCTCPTCHAFAHKPRAADPAATPTELTSDPFLFIHRKIEIYSSPFWSIVVRSLGQHALSYADLAGINQALENTMVESHSFSQLSLEDAAPAQTVRSLLWPCF